jgi:hypothetical protein
LPLWPPFAIPALGSLRFALANHPTIPREKCQLLLSFIKFIKIISENKKIRASDNAPFWHSHQPEALFGKKRRIHPAPGFRKGVSLRARRLLPLGTWNFPLPPNPCPCVVKIQPVDAEKSSAHTGRHQHPDLMHCLQRLIIL